MRVGYTPPVGLYCSPMPRVLCGGCAIGFGVGGFAVTCVALVKG